MRNNQNATFLTATLSKLLPEVFFHPVWTNLVRTGASYSPESLRLLLSALERENIKDDLNSNCQLIFLSAYLQSRLGEHATALARMEEMWQLAGVHSLEKLAWCAAWGACAICFRQGDYREAIAWLGKLQDRLQENSEWILISVLELFRQSLEEDVPNPYGDLLAWFTHWGESTPPEAPYSSTSSFQTQPGMDHPIRRVAGLFRNLSWLGNFIRNWLHGKLLSFQSLRQAEPITGIDNQVGKLAFEQRAWPVRKVKPVPAPTFWPNEDPPPSRLLSSDARALQAHPGLSPSVSLPVRKEPGLPSLAVYCLGQFQVYQDEQLVESWLSRKALSILKYLILEHPVPVPKEVLMDTFWPDSDLESARRNLHQAIYALRQILRGEQPEFHHVFFKNDCYSLHPNVDTWIDFREFEKCIQTGRKFDHRGEPEKAIEQYGTAEGLYQGDFLEEDLYEDWPLLQREQLRNSYCSLVDRLTTLYLQIGQYTSVIHLCHKVLAKDRCYESAHRMLMQSYSVQGQRHLAVRQYQTCIRALREDLGMQPSQETIDLYHHITSRRGV
jgi:DNA-binding SARP family transcriptional activator